MVNSIGSGGGGLGRQAIEAQLKRMAEKVGAETSNQDAGKVDGSAFTEMVKNGVAELDASVQRSGELHIEAIQGTLDLHEVSAQLKQSELAFQFTMQVRNKFIDAYREVMRMSI